MHAPHVSLFFITSNNVKTVVLHLFYITSTLLCEDLSSDQLQLATLIACNNLSNFFFPPIFVTPSLAFSRTTTCMNNNMDIVYHYLALFMIIFTFILSSVSMNIHCWSLFLFFTQYMFTLFRTSHNHSTLTPIYIFFHSYKLYSYITIFISFTEFHLILKINITLFYNKVSSIPFYQYIYSFFPFIFP